MRSRPSRSRCSLGGSSAHNERLCLAPLPTAARSVMPSMLKRQVSVLAQKSCANTHVKSGAARQCGGGVVPARPAVAGARLALRCSFPRPRARTRPPHGGSPKAKVRNQKQEKQTPTGRGALSINTVKHLTSARVCKMLTPTVAMRCKG
jgi:hypothetical protein